MFFRGAREASIQILGSNTYSAYPQYDTGTTFLNQSYLYSVSHIFTPSLFLSVKASYTRFNENNSYDPSLVETPSLMFVSPTDPNTGAFIQMPGLENLSEPGSAVSRPEVLRTPFRSSPISPGPRANTPCASDF